MVDSNAAQQTRDHVVRKAKEIEQLSKSQIQPAEFFQKFLETLVEAMGAQAGVVWTRGQGNRLQIISERGLADTGLTQNPQTAHLNQQILMDVMSNGQARVLSPDEEKVATNHVHIFAALHSNKQTLGIVQIFQRADSPIEARSGYLQFVEQMTWYASKYLENRSKQSNGGVVSSQFWNDFEQFVLQLQRSLDLGEVTTTLVNDGRLLMECDRVSIALRRGKRTYVQAISGQDIVNSRANLVRTMKGLSKATIDLGEKVLYTGKIESLAPQIEEPLANYIQESGSRMVLAIPLFENDPLVHKDDEDEHANKKRKRARRKCIGCLIIEQVSDSQPEGDLLERADLVADHAAAAIDNALSHHRLFLLPIWQFLGDCLEWFQGRKLAKTAAVLAVLTAIVCALVYVPWEYRVEGEGRLMPVVQREIFAPWDGDVVEIYVKGGDRVQAGQPLLRIRDDQLESEIVQQRNAYNESLELIGALQAQLDTAVRAADREEELRVQARLVQTKIQLQGIREQFKVLTERKDKLKVKSPIDGVVATFQVEQLLRTRPVRRGEVLLEVMDDTQDWRLELVIAEHRMGHLLQAQKDAGDPHLPVEFILATDTEVTFEGQLESLATRSVDSQELGSVVEAYADLDASQLPRRRIGAEVRAKISCGDKSLGYVLFGDVIEFVRQYFWL